MSNIKTPEEKEKILNVASERKITVELTEKRFNICKY